MYLTWCDCLNSNKILHQHGAGRDCTIRCREDINAFEKKLEFNNDSTIFIYNNESMIYSNIVLQIVVLIVAHIY